MSETIRRPLYVTYEYKGKGLVTGSGRTVLFVARPVEAGDTLTFEDVQDIETKAMSLVDGGVKDGRLFLTWWQWLRPSDPTTPEPSP